MELKQTYTFWVSTQRTQLKIDKDNYNSNLHKVADFNTVDQFWHIYQYMARASSIPEGCQILLFQKNINPMWEDEANQGGGRFVLRVRQNVDQFWEKLVLSYIGEQCKANEHICGLVMNSKKNFAQISIWVRDFNKLSIDEQDQMDKWVIQIFGVTKRAELEFVGHPKAE